MIFSTIDIGTNTILMVTLEVARDGTIEILGDEHEIARLGKGVDATKTILPETFDRVEGYLHRYRGIARSLGAERIIAFGTSALRDARNRQEFIDTMKERTGIEIEVLSGEEEAECTFRGAGFKLEMEPGRRAVLDIGGGSTEIAYGIDINLERALSIDIGAVRTSDRFLTTLPPSPPQIQGARSYLRAEIEKAFELPQDVAMIGVAGTVTTLGAIASGISNFDAEQLNGFRLSCQEVSRITQELTTLTLAETIEIPQVHPGRADVLLGGVLILDEFMKRNDLPEITVSTRGVRYGVAMREIERVSLL